MKTLPREEATCKEEPRRTVYQGLQHPALPAVGSAGQDHSTPARAASPCIWEGSSRPSALPQVSAGQGWVSQGEDPWVQTSGSPLGGLCLRGTSGTAAGIQRVEARSATLYLAAHRTAPRAKTYPAPKSKS